MAEISMTFSERVDVAGLSLEGTGSYSAAALSVLDEVVASDADEALIWFALDVSEVKGFIMIADQDLLVITNAVDPGQDDSITLKANRPYNWHTNSHDSFKLGTDVVKFYVTNQSDPAVATRLKVFAVVDPTP